MSVIYDIAGTSHNSFSLGKTTLMQGDDNPSSLQGKDGDIYFQSNGKVYSKKNGTWSGISGGSGGGLLDVKWSDHIISDPSWLRSDTYEWYSGNVYSEAYELLVSEYDNGTEITEYKLPHLIKSHQGPKGFKVIDANASSSSVSHAAYWYAMNGVAWYYIIDKTNRRFKLPRSKWGFVGLRNSVGKYVDESLPNISGQVGFADNEGSILFNDVSGVFSSDGSRGSNMTSSDAYGSAQSRLLKFNASNSSSTYQDNAPVQQRATQMYLYFYAGDFSQPTSEKISYIEAQLNNKADKSDVWTPTASTTAQKETIVGWGIPNYNAIVSRSVDTTYTASQKGWIYVFAGQWANNKYGTLTINGVDFRYKAAGENVTTDGGLMLPIDNGDTYKANNVTNGLFYFIPMKGL